jgi:hypothetical protein
MPSVPEPPGSSASHQGHSHGLPPPVQGAAGGDKLQTSWRVSMDIWIRRFKEAQQARREVEDKLERTEDLLKLALSLMTEDQLASLKEIQEKG